MIFAYLCSLWLVFYLLNYADITARPAKWLKDTVGPKWGYPLSCAACMPFWTSFLVFLTYGIPLWWVPVVTVSHLFLDLTYQRLSGNCPICNGGTK